MKKLLVIMSVVFFLCIPTAQAYQVTFTGDNVVGLMVTADPGLTEPFDIWDLEDDPTLAPNYDNWRVADTLDIPDSTPVPHALIFIVENLPNPSSGNPGGFLAEITGDPLLGQGSLLTSSAWEVATNLDDDPTSWAWQSATEYGANDDSTTIWYDNQLPSDGPVVGISGSAQWIWTANNFTANTDQRVAFKIEVVVPEPSTMLLLGIGLIGLFTLGRKKLLKK